MSSALGNYRQAHVSAEQAEALLAKSASRARVYQLNNPVPVSLRGNAYDGPTGCPTTVTILTPEGDAARLFVDEREIDATHWSLTARLGGEVLSWDHSRDGEVHRGNIEFHAGRFTGHGFAAVNGVHHAVAANLAPVTYSCDLAPHLGRGAYVTGSSLELVWDTSTKEWKDAVWVKGALEFTYSLDGAVVIGQKSYTVHVSFADTDTGATWTPTDGLFSAELTSDLRFVFNDAPEDILPEDDRSGLRKDRRAIESVFSEVVAFQFDAWAANITGALLVGVQSAESPVYALRGTAGNSCIVGKYVVNTADGRATTIAVRGGKLVIAGVVLEGSRIRGSVLHWEDAPAMSGLTTSGSLSFTDDGEAIEPDERVISGRRVACVPSPAFAARQGDPQPLDVHVLMQMTQFSQDSQGNWSDAVQRDAMQDFYTLIQFYMDDDLREEFLSPHPPQLSPQVTNIAHTLGPKGENPADFYSGLSTYYLVSALASSSTDDFAKTLNRTRAANWLKGPDVSQAPVYQVHSPLLYRNQWLQRYPSTQNYLDDGVTNSSTYATLITDDTESWRTEAKATTTDPTDLKDLLDVIDLVEAQGLKDNYYPYVIYRLATTPAALNMLRLLSLSGNVSDGSLYARHIQSVVALLNVLDTEGVFVREYMKIVQLFQIGNVLPTLLDYSGDTDDFSYAADQIVTAFVDKYLNSTDPDFAKAAEAMQEAQAKGQIAEIIHSLAGAAMELPGVYGWNQLTAWWERNLPLRLRGIPAATAKLVAFTSAAAGVAGFVLGVKSWKSLNAVARGQVVATAVSVFSGIGEPLIRRGAALATLFEADELSWATLKPLFNSAGVDAVEQRLSSGFASWLMRTGERPPGYSEMFGNLFVEGADEDMTLATKVFGRNLEVFLATRLGAMLSIANLVLASLAVADSKDDLEKAGNWLFVGSAALELFAAAGSWAISAEVGAIGFLEISALVPGLQALAVVAAVVGTILMIIDMNKTQPSPVQVFAQKQAADAGLYMPDKADIDSLQVFSPDAKTPSFVGLTFTASADSSKLLTMHADKSVTCGPATGDYTTAFFMKTDGHGTAQIASIQTVDTHGGQALRYLTADPGTKVLAASPLIDSDARKPVDPATYQQWRAEFVGGVQWNGNSVLSAQFKLYNVGLTSQDGSSAYLVVAGDSVSIDSGNPTVWTLAMIQLGSEDLTADPLNLYTYQRDQHRFGSLAQPGSDPKTWTIAPALPGFLTLDASTGEISQKPGVAPELFAAEDFTLTVTNSISTTSATLTVEVQDPPIQPPAPTQVAQEEKAEASRA